MINQEIRYTPTQFVRIKRKIYRKLYGTGWRQKKNIKRNKTIVDLLKTMLLEEKKTNKSTYNSNNGKKNIIEKEKN